MATAFAHHQTGRFAQAQAGYQRLLASAPDNVVVMQLLAVLSLQTGQDDTAIALLLQAVEVNADLVAAHVNLGIFSRRGATLAERPHNIAGRRWFAPKTARQMCILHGC